MRVRSIDSARDGVDLREHKKKGAPPCMTAGRRSFMCGVSTRGVGNLRDTARVLIPNLKQSRAGIAPRKCRVIAVNLVTQRVTRRVASSPCPLGRAVHCRDEPKANLERIDKNERSAQIADKHH